MCMNKMSVHDVHARATVSPFALEGRAAQRLELSLRRSLVAGGAEPAQTHAGQVPGHGGQLLEAGAVMFFYQELLGRPGDHSFPVPGGMNNLLRLHTWM